MGVSTVKLNGTTLMTVNDSTATSADVSDQEYFYTAAGNRSLGALDLDSYAKVADEILHFSGQTVSAASNAQICRIPASGTNSAITADHVLLEAVWGNPAYITSNVTWTTYAGYMTLTGTATAATTVTVTLGKKGN